MSLTDPQSRPAEYAAHAVAPASHVRLTSLYDIALRAMQARLARTLLTALGIVIGVAVILAVDVTNATTLASIRNLFDETSGRASLLVEPAALGTEGFDEGVARDVARFAGVQTVAPLITLQAALVGDTAPRTSAFATSPQGGITVLGVDPAVDVDVRIYDLDAGRLLTPDDERAAVIGKALAEDRELDLGETLVVVTPDGELGLEVVGIIDKVGVGRTGDGKVVIAPLTTVQDAFLLRGQLNQVDIVIDTAITDNADRLEAFKSELDVRLPRNVDVAYPAARGKLISQMLATYQFGLNFFSAIAIFVGGFLIYNAFSMTVLERTREIGMLRSIGATRRQIVFLILTEALLLAICGALLGVLAGIVLANSLISAMGNLLAVTLETFTVPRSSLVKSLSIGIGVTLASALLPAWRGSHVSPLEALRIHATTEQPSALGHWHWVPGATLFVVCYALLQTEVLPGDILMVIGILAIFGMLLGAALLVSSLVQILEPLFRPLLIGLYGPEGHLGSSNVQRARARTALTVSALMIGVSMVIALGEQTNSFRNDLLNWVDTAIGGDLYVRSVTPMRPEFGRRLAALPGVQAVTPTSFTSARLVAPNDDNEPDAIVVRAIEPETYLQVASFKFADQEEGAAQRVARLARGDAVFVTTTLADRYDIDAGDTIVLETDRGRRPFVVAGIIVDFSVQGNTMTMTRQDLDRYFGQRRVNTFTLAVQPGIDSALVADEIKDRYEDREHITVESSAEFRNRIIDLMNQSFAMLNALVGIALIVSSLGIINTLMMNILERIREIGMLRSLGMTRRQVAKMILAESATMGVTGSLLGLLLGLLLADVFIKGTNLAGGYRIAYIFSPVPVVLGVIIALALSQAAAFYPAQRAMRVNIVDAIKHE